MNEKCSIHKAKKIKIQSFPTGFKTSIVCVRVGRERERENLQIMIPLKIHHWVYDLKFP
jgi:hypothetical protein